MRLLLALFVSAEAAIQSVLAAGAKAGGNKRKTIGVVRNVLAALRIRAIGTPDKPGAAWDAVAEAYRQAARDASKPHTQGRSTGLGVRHTRSAQRLYRRLSDRLDVAIAHVAHDLEGALGARSVADDEIPEVKGFTDKAGRRWDLAVYARMCARTIAAEARSEATVNALLDQGVDLVEVSKHPHPNDICSRFEGRVFSISGGHPRYTKLRERPPFHPNCKHVLREYRRGDGSIVRPASVRQNALRVDTDSLAAFLQGDGLFVDTAADVVRVDREGRVFLNTDDIGEIS